MLTQEALSMSCFSIYETINMPYLWPGQRLKILALTCCLTKRSQSFHCPPQKRKSETRLTTSVLKEIQNTQTVKQNAFCRTRQDKLPKRQILSDVYPRSGELQTQKFKSHLVRTQSLNVLPLKPGIQVHRSVYSHTCYAYCQGFLPRFFLPFQSIHLHFFQKPLPILLVLAVASTWFLCRPAA